MQTIAVETAIARGSIPTPSSSTTTTPRWPDDEQKQCLVALDVGGTKTHLVVETLKGERILDTVISSQDWDAEPASHGADWLAARLKANLPAGISLASIAFGAQGINNLRTGRDLEAALLERGYRVLAVNDAALIVPAAGFKRRHRRHSRNRCDRRWNGCVRAADVGRGLGMRDRRRRRGGSASARSGARCAQGERRRQAGRRTAGRPDHGFQTSRMPNG